MGVELLLFPADNGALKEVGDLVDLQVHRCPIATTTSV